MRNRINTFITIIFSILMVSVVHLANAEPIKLRVAGPPAGLLSLPVYRMMDQNALADQEIELEFVPWKTPEQLRAIILSGQADIIAMHTTGAANLHNRGVNLRMMNVTLWNILWVVSTDETIKSMEDLKGKELTMAFKGDMPEIVFKETARHYGMNPIEDLQLNFVSTAQELSQHLLIGRVQTAIIPDPPAAVAVYKAKEKGITLHRCFNLAAAWNKGKENKGLPLAGVAYIPSDILTDQILTEFNKSYMEAVQWASQNPTEAGLLLNKKIPVFASEAVTDAIQHTLYTSKISGESKTEILTFLEIILKNNPDSIGGKLPSDSFFWSPNEHLEDE
jgi:NitT/TauT family transport system substrate-binding protein